MSFWHFLNHWWNLPYLVMLGLVGVFFGLQAVGIFTHHSDGDADGDADHDVEHEHDSDHEGAVSSIAAFLGVGRVPFLVVWLTLFIFAGFGGLFINRVLSASSYPAWGFPLSLLGSLFIGGFLTRFTARQVAKLIDVSGNGSARRRELQGRWGVVASPSCDREFGEVRVRDARGNELLVHGKLADGPSLPQGSRVLLLEFDPQSELYTVEKFEPEEGTKKER